MANHEVYVVQGKTLDNIAGTMRAVLGVDKDTPIRFDEVASSDKTEQINADVETQTDLIAQIKTALNGKAGSSAAEIGALIDESGVLDSTDGTATEKVEQLIDKAQWEQIWYEASGTWTTVFDFSLFVGAKAIPKLNFENAVRTRGTFKQCLAERIDYYINSGKSTSNSRMCQDCKSLKFFYGVDMTNTTSCEYLFQGCGLLETIQEPLNFSKVTTNGGCFQNCNSLINIKLVTESIKVSITIPSPVLSKESISGEQGIINGLNSEVTGQTLTLNLNAVKKAFETSEGANDGDTSAEWLALKDSKPNWTISLS